MDVGAAATAAAAVAVLVADALLAAGRPAALVVMVDVGPAVGACVLGCVPCTGVGLRMGSSEKVSMPDMMAVRWAKDG